MHNKIELDPQLGYPEEWLCSIFANLTQDLSLALRTAWLSMMIIHKRKMCQAELTEHSHMLANARTAFPSSKRVSHPTLHAPFFVHRPIFVQPSSEALLAHFLADSFLTVSAQIVCEPWLVSCGVDEMELGSFDRSSFGVTR